MKLMTKKLLILSLFFIVFLFRTGDVFAWIPGTVSGTVEAELPDGSRVGLVGAVIYRQDFWTFSYCENGGSCFGHKDGVETVVGAGGIYSMGNDQNIPDPVCYTNNQDGQAKLCPAGEKGKVDYSKSDGDILECKKEPDNNYSDISAQGLNWCGFNCGANPHRWEAYFPETYKLPGDLVSQGYSHLRGHWVLGGTDKNYYEEEVGNHGNVPDKNFIFVLDEPNTPDDLLTCKSLTASVLGTGQYAGQTPQISSLPNDFTGAITLTCVSESTSKPVNKMEFSFVKDQVEQKKLIDPNSSADIVCSNLLDTYTCTGSVFFDITGSGNYSARSKVCIVDGSTEKCSQ